MRAAALARVVGRPILFIRRTQSQIYAG